MPADNELPDPVYLRDGGVWVTFPYRADDLESGLRVWTGEDEALRFAHDYQHRAVLIPWGGTLEDAARVDDERLTALGRSFP